MRQSRVAARDLRSARLEADERRINENDCIEHSACPTCDDRGDRGHGMEHTDCRARAERLPAHGGNFNMIGRHGLDHVRCDRRLAAAAVVTQIIQDQLVILPERRPEAAITVDGKTIAVRQDQPGPPLQRVQPHCELDAVGAPRRDQR